MSKLGLWSTGGAVVVCITAWELLVRVADLSPRMLSAPSAIVGELARTPGFFVTQSLVTTAHVAVGLAVSLGIAVAIGGLMIRSAAVEALAQPFLIMIMVTPWVAYITSVVLAVGAGRPAILSQVALVTLPAFAYALVGGLRSAEPDTIDVFRSVGATPAEILRHVRIPAAMPSVFTALRFNIGLGLGAAYFAEGASANSGTYVGLGEGGKRAMSLAPGEVLWATIMCAAIIGLVAQVAVAAVERRVLRWHASQR